MGLIDFFKKKSNIIRLTGKDPVWSNRSFSVYQAGYETFITKGYGMNPHVFTVVGFILKKLSRIPFYAVEVTKDGEEKRVGPDHRISKLLEKPNESESWREFFKNQLGFYLLTGESFTYGLTLDSLGGVLSEIYNVPGPIVEVKEGNFLNPVQGYYISVFKNQDLIGFDNMLHIRDFNPHIQEFGGFAPRGLSPLEAALRGLKRSNEGFDRAVALFENGAPPGIIASDSETIGLEEEDIDALQEQYKKRYGHGRKANIPLFGSAKLKWHQIGMKSTDLELLETEKADLKLFCRMYGVPVPLISQEDSSTYNNIKELKASFWEDTGIPLLDIFLENYQEFFVRGEDRGRIKLKYDLSGVSSLKDKNIDERNLMLKEMEFGLWTPDQYRNKIGEDPTGAPHGEQYIIRKYAKGRNSNSQESSES